MLDAAAAALRSLAPGPGNWVVANDLYHLQESYGHPFAFSSVTLTALSAKLRVVQCDRLLLLQQRLPILSAARVEVPLRHRSWTQWYDHSPFFVLERARLEAQALGINLLGIWSELASAHSSPKRFFQNRVYRCLLARDGYMAEYRLREKLERWQVNATPIGTLTRRACNRLPKLLQLVSPRVGMAVFRAWWNGWCTARRIQDRTKRCVFRCSCEFSEDSIEHYCCCPSVRDFAWCTLHLPARLSGSLSSFLVLEPGLPDEILTLQALLVYATDSARNSCWHNVGMAASPSFVPNALLLQHAKQGTYNHAKSWRVLATALEGRTATHP